jgi:hypothetical protein
VIPLSFIRIPPKAAAGAHFVANVAADNRVNNYFSRTNILHLKMELVDQICLATGGVVYLHKKADARGARRNAHH